MIEEYIVCSAIKLGNIVVAGVRHDDCVNTIVALKGKEYLIECVDNGRYTEGFVTSTGRFMDREQAYKFAVENGQVEENDSEILASEDLY